MRAFDMLVRTAGLMLKATAIEFAVVFVALFLLWLAINIMVGVIRRVVRGLPWR